MYHINRVIQGGNLTRDAELKFTNSGTPFLNFSIANNVYIGGENKSEYVSFFECVLWGKRAQSLQPYLLKGTGVIVDGKLRQDRWEKDGYSRSRCKINVDELNFTGGKKDGNNQNRSASPPVNTGTPANTGQNDDFEDDIPF